MAEISRKTVNLEQAGLALYRRNMNDYDDFELVEHVWQRDPEIRRFWTEQVGFMVDYMEAHAS